MINFKYISATALLLIILCFAGCKEEDTPADTVATETISILSVPGVISLPDSDGFVSMEESEHEVILLYCWLPIGEYPENDGDLTFLSSLNERGVTAVPIQFNTTVRNAAQTQLNSMDISLSVALGDETLKDFLVTDNLPVATLVHANGTVVSAYGFGCAERVLRGIQ